MQTQEIKKELKDTYTLVTDPTIISSIEPITETNQPNDAI